MGCGSCSKRSKYANRVSDVSKELFGDYKYLSNAQIEARLASYKRHNCTQCDKRYECNYTSFLICKQGE
jgi:hypothetical protein